ncbi:hypothetical protein CCHR01_14662 [Colletotrichum chrysophilum]|uniref:Uncharacterized protein n=1 Tax=Colletotrichum chrysophilum TaxID=1836956 RepID=A0AAD9E9D5_9PEZI|nr:hypothetical protein CCHR01_14662 [Colletotrichum chrysophilum]
MRAGRFMQAMAGSTSRVSILRWRARLTDWRGAFGQRSDNCLNITTYCNHNYRPALPSRWFFVRLKPPTAGRTASEVSSPHADYGRTPPRFHVGISGSEVSACPRPPVAARDLLLGDTGIPTGGNRGSTEGWNMHRQQQQQQQLCVKLGSPQLCALASTRYLRPVSTLPQPASSTLVTEDRSLAKTLHHRDTDGDGRRETGDGRRRLE